MIFIKRLIPYFSAGLVILSLEWSLNYYLNWQFWVIALLLNVVLTVLFLNKFRLNKETFGFMVSPVCFLLSSLAFLYFQEAVIWQQAIIFGGSLLYWLFINNISNFLYQSKSYLPYSLESVSNYLNLVAIFFTYITCFSFFILTVSRLRWLIILIFLVTLLLTWQSMWINKIHQRFNFFIFVLPVVITEMYWALHYWPTSFFVCGFILTLIYYIFTTFVKLHHLENLNKKNVIRHLALSSLILIIVLSTTTWA